MGTVEDSVHVRMSTAQDLPIVELRDQQAWRDWLEENHEALPGVWLKFAKKGAPTPTVTYPEAIEEALCFGWIDGQVRRYDELYYLQRFTPRRPKSKWSQINREKATRLIAVGRMRAPGMAQVEAARADGRWEAAYPGQGQATVPEDFQRALDENLRARNFFGTLTGSNRYAFLYRLHQVRDPEARAARISKYIELLAAGKTLQD
jgi:uncharacterized protein YdeI (YjbR/CyaY-like superfamily)